ncbi:MAG: DUF2723 domain-containing protein [Brumimicrobium sp.]|nr:DUF2723 domain-containing protein [Brumimicrobium sp.]
MNYKKINIILGWLTFLIASYVFIATAEETASLWDCGEFITSIYKLEVGHPPGAPFFMLIGRLFALFAGSPAEVAHWVNIMSALSSSLTIVFLFWTITLLGKKVAEKGDNIMSSGQKIAILGSAFVGSMVYTFTESFWFSAVEGEVYAMASLFTAVVFWAALKWDEEMTLIRRGELTMDAHPLRWMVLIMFLLGLAIGVHLLGILVIPAIAYIVAYQLHTDTKSEIKLFLITGIVGVLVLGFIQNGIIPGTIAIASKMEIIFVDSFGLPFNSGAIFFFILLIGILVGGLFYTKKKGYVLGNTIVLSLIVFLIGYGSFATIVIRSNANTPLDENNPENLVTLHAYLKREQYGTWPLMYGPYFNSKLAPQNQYEDRSPTYDRRWVVQTKSGSAITSFKDKKSAEEYIQNSGANYNLDEKYFVTNENIRLNQMPTYLQNTIFPRMFDQSDPTKIEGYKNWSGYDPNRKVPAAETGADGRPIPTFGENISYLINYQIGWMYWRYFMWNFAGRQNDIQGHGDEMRGNWISGYSIVDNARLGDQGENAPFYTSQNSSHYKFYYLPLILGLIGMFFHFLKAPKDALVVGMLFLLTGLAIVIYLNQKPFEPRERDYAYAASFYAFAIWIGLGVYGLYEAFSSFGKEEYKKLGISFGALLLLCFIADLSAPRGLPATMSILIMGGIGGGAMVLMTALRKINLPTSGAASLAVVMAIVAPILMGMQNWEGHDRSNRTPARALAYNYLVGCSPNAILYTNGDNDTFPLWYLQEVEGIRTDVRVANLSLMQTDWYTEQMKMRAYESDPLPIKFREDQILMGAGNTDYVLFVDYEIYKNMLSPEKAKEIIEKKIESNPKQFREALTNIRRGLAATIQTSKGNTPKAQEDLNKMFEELVQNVENPGIKEYDRTNTFIRKVLTDINSKAVTPSGDMATQLQSAAESWTASWDFLPVEYIMEFVRDDKNMLEQPGRKLRFFPSSGFILKVNADNAVKAGIIPKELKDKTVDEIRFNFRKGGLFRSDIRGLSREEMVMLDILANFEWTRGIYFSSPGGSDVAKSLYAIGALKNLGQIHGLTPLKSDAADKFARDEMYSNIVKKFDYGNLNGDKVLVDYYVRRHTDQYRNNFLDLASKYYNDLQIAKQRLMLDSTATAQKDIDFLVGKIDTILTFGLEQLPIAKVFDMGEPRAIGHQLSNGESIYTDGILPEYIRLIYEIGKTDKADQLAIEYMKQLESMMNYFSHSDAMIAYNNKKDFISLSMNFLRTYAQVFVSSPKSGAAQYGQELENKLTNEVVKGVMNDLKSRQINESVRGKVRTRSMEKEAIEFAETYNALLEENGFGEGE